MPWAIQITGGEVCVAEVPIIAGLTGDYITVRNVLVPTKRHGELIVPYD